MTRFALIVVMALTACDSKSTDTKPAAADSAAAGAEKDGADKAADPKPAAAEKPDDAEAKAPEGEAAIDPVLLDPSKATAQAPDAFKAKFETTKGAFVVAVDRSKSPQGADRFYNLVKIGYFGDTAFFRAIDGFMVQFGLHGEPSVNRAWRQAQIDDDPVKGSNKRGMVTFAKQSAPNSRTTQIFINYKDNANLDGMGFSPFGEVVEGMDVVDSLYKGYGEGAPSGRGPSQGRIQSEGNAYLKKDFPELDYIKSASIIEPAE